MKKNDNPLPLKKERNLREIKRKKQRTAALENLQKEMSNTSSVYNTTIEQQSSEYTVLELSKKKLSAQFSDIYGALNSLKLPIVLLGSDLKLKIVTVFAEKRFGVKRSNVGKSIYKIKFPLDATKLRSVINRVVKKSVSVRVPIKSPKGYWYSLRISPFRKTDKKAEGVVMVFVGIDRLKRSLVDSELSRSKLKRRESYFRSLIEQSHDIIVLRDKNANILYVSPSNKRIFGYKKKEFKGKHWYDFVHPDDKTIAHEYFNNVIRDPQKPVVMDYRFLHKDGSWRWIEGSLTNLLDDPNVHAIVVNYRDVTDRKDLEKLKDEFASISSHELRTPLANIRWKLESVLDGDYGEVTAKVRDELKKLESENNKLISLVNKLLDVSRVQGKSINGKTEKIIVRPMVEKVLSDFDKQIESKKIKVNINIHDNISYKGDSEILESVVSNLIENAIKYNKHNGQIVIYVRDRVRVMEIEVVDTGIGISEADRKNIFKKFYRTREAAKVMSGVGLGLYSTKLHVSRMGGKIDFKSSPGMGSKFKVMLPKE